MATFFVIAPSYFAQVANGLLILVFLYVILSNYSSFLKINYVTKLQIIGTLAIALGVHGSLHLGLEQAYNYNPLFIFA
jgi:hypothetical protein